MGIYSSELKVSRNTYLAYFSLLGKTLEFSVVLFMIRHCSVAEIIYGKFMNIREKIRVINYCKIQTSGGSR